MKIYCCQYRKNIYGMEGCNEVHDMLKTAKPLGKSGFCLVVSQNK